MTKIEMARVKLTEEEIEAAVKVLRSGGLRQGGECEAFEREFADKVGAKHAFTCSNGTAALHLAYMLVLEPGDEVLVPSFTFIATASMVVMAGCRPIFCDVDPDTFLIDLDDAAGRITDRAKAIAPVHLFGNCCDVEAVRFFAEKHGLYVVWDAAQAHGAMYKGRDVGSFGELVCYSFYPSKNMFVGEGGMVCTDNDDYAEKLAYLRSHGQTGPYLHEVIAPNYRMTDVEAAIGRKQLERLDAMLSVRRRNASIYNEALGAIKGLKLQKITPSSEHAWHQYCFAVDGNEFGMSRDDLAERLRNDGIGSGVHYPRGLNRQPAFIDLYGPKNMPVTDELAENILAIPVHHGLEEDDIRRVIDSIVKAARV